MRKYYTINENEVVKVMSNKDLVTYYRFICDKAENTDYKYEISTNLNPMGIHDCIQLKFDADGNMDFSFIEIKGRNVRMADYEDCVVDAKKIQRLLNLKEQSGKRVFVVAIYYPDYRICIWELDEGENYETTEMMVTKTQSVPNAEKVMRKMVKLPISKAKKFRYRKDN